MTSLYLCVIQRGLASHNARGLAGLFTICLLLVTGLGGCYHPPRRVEAQAGADGMPRVAITAPGLTRVLIARPAAQAPWPGFSLQASGNQPVRQIRFWGLGRNDLVAPSAAAKTEEVFTPFDLLPRESCALTVDSAGALVKADAAKAPPASTLRGLCLWELPASAEALQAALRRSAGLNWDTTHGLLLGTNGATALLEFAFSSPLPHSRVEMAWDFAPAATEPEIWLSLDGEAWVKQSARRVAQPWNEPLDLTAAVHGQRRFMLRVQIPGERFAETGPVVLRRLRIEREFQAPGRLREWRPGLNEISLQIAGGSGPLELRWLGGE